MFFFAPITMRIIFIYNGRNGNYRNRRTSENKVILVWTLSSEEEEGEANNGKISAISAIWLPLKRRPLVLRDLNYHYQREIIILCVNSAPLRENKHISLISG